MPTRRQYLASAISIGAATLAGCAGPGADLPDSEPTPTAGWSLPQGTPGATRTNPETEYMTSDLETVGRYIVSGEVVGGIKSAVPTEDGVIVFAEGGVRKVAWDGTEAWAHDVASSTQTGAVVSGTVVTVTPSEIIGLEYGTGDVVWTMEADDVVGEGFDTAPTFTEYLTAGDGIGDVSDGVCIGTTDAAGVVVVNGSNGSVGMAYELDGRGELQSHPTYDAANDVFVMLVSEELIGFDAQALEEAFRVDNFPQEDLFTQHGISIGHVGAGSITAADTTLEQWYESDVESETPDLRLQWTTGELNPVLGPPSRVGTQAVFPTESGIEAVSISSGAVTWQAVGLGACVSVAASKGHLYALTEQGRVFVVDGHTGEQITDYLVDGHWSELAVWGEYILLVDPAGEIGIVTGEQSRAGLEPLLKVVNDDMLGERLTFTRGDEIEMVHDEPINGIDDLPGTDVSGLIEDIVQQYEDGEIPYIRARNMLERMVHYFAVLDLGIELIQRNRDIPTFSVGEGRPVTEDSLTLPPEFARGSDVSVDELTNSDVSFAMAHGRRVGQGILDTAGTVPMVGGLKSTQNMFNVLSGEFRSLHEDFMRDFVEILTNSGAEAATDYVRSKEEDGVLPSSTASALTTWVEDHLVSSAVAVGDANVILSSAIESGLDAFIELLAASEATRYEYAVEIPLELIVTEYTDIGSNEYGRILDDDDRELHDEDEIPIELTHSFSDRYSGVTAAEVPKNVTESDLLDNLDRIDSLPGNQFQAMSASVALQRGLLEQAQDTVAQAFPLDLVDETGDMAAEVVGGLYGELGSNAVESAAELVDMREEVSGLSEATGNVLESRAEIRVRGLQGLAEFSPYGGIANLTHTARGVMQLQRAMNDTLSIVSNHGSHDILLGVHESDPGDRTLLGRPETHLRGDERTAFDDFSEFEELNSEADDTSEGDE